MAEKANQAPLLLLLLLLTQGDVAEAFVEAAGEVFRLHHMVSAFLSTEMLTSAVVAKWWMMRSTVDETSWSRTVRLAPQWRSSGKFSTARVSRVQTFPIPLFSIFFLYSLLS